MNRLAVPLASAGLLVLAACASAPAPEGDVATYDSLREASARCRAEGKELALRPDGNDRRLSGYECRGK